MPLPENPSPPPSEEAAIAHIVRRLTFGPQPGLVEQLKGDGVDGAIDRLLSAADPPLNGPRVGEPGHEPPSGAYENLVGWWAKRVLRPEVGLADKMTMFWHSHFTSSLDKVGSPAFMWRQHLLLRQHALGNFRQLVRDITTDAAMLIYLDGNQSKREAPNENYSRELMELFTIGRGNYNEGDVQDGALALSGWYVEEDGDVQHDDVEGNTSNISFLGKTGILNTDDVVDAVCDHPACAPFIAAKVHRFLVGVEPSDERRNELAGVFRDANLDIRSLVESIVRHPSFLQLRLNRARLPMEWLAAAASVFDVRPEPYVLEQLGQVPFEPPNVAGWPLNDRWLSTSQALVRMSASATWAQGPGASGSLADIDAALAHCSLYEVSDATRQAIVDAGSRISDPQSRSVLNLALAVASPEFALA